MKLLIRDSHISFYKQNGFIEFEDILSIDQVDKLKNEIDSILKKRNPTQKTDKFEPYTIYKNSRDLFRDSDFIKSIDTHKNLSSIAATLTKKRSLRLAYDQAIYSNSNESFFDDFACLDDISCYQGIVSALIIRLDNSLLDDKTLELPSKKASCIYIKNDFPINFEKIFSSDNKFFMIVYANPKAVYKFNESDPNKNCLKSLGFVFGDTLKDEYNPIVY